MQIPLDAPPDTHHISKNNYLRPVRLTHKTPGRKLKNQDVITKDALRQTHFGPTANVLNETLFNTSVYNAMCPPQRGLPSSTRSQFPSSSTTLQICTLSSTTLLICMLSSTTWTQFPSSSTTCTHLPLLSITLHICMLSSTTLHICTLSSITSAS